MEPGRNTIIGMCAVIASLVIMVFDQVRAHGGGNWDPFTIDGANDDARIEVIKVQAFMTDIIRGRAGTDQWPVKALQESRDKLLSVKEVVDEILEHYVTDGVNIHTVQVLHANPRAGRTVAASRALDAGISIIEHAASLDSAKAFVAEFHSRAMAARLFELVEVNVDRMDLYAVMTASADQLRVPDSLPE